MIHQATVGTMRAGQPERDRNNMLELEHTVLEARTQELGREAKKRVRKRGLTSSRVLKDFAIRLVCDLFAVR